MDFTLDFSPLFYLSFPLLFLSVLRFTNVHLFLHHLGARNRSRVFRKHIYWRKAKQKTRVILVVVQGHKKKLLSLW